MKPQLWDVIVVGAGISGLTAAAALAKAGQKVLVLEQHWVAGGLTQTFKRGDWHFATGVHYLSGVGEANGPAGQFRRLLAWLTDDAIRFAPLANPYDIVKLPDFSFGIRHPEAAFHDDLIARFPADRTSIDHWFGQMKTARNAASTLLLERALPGWLAWAARLWSGDATTHFAHTTVAEALRSIQDAQLRAVLGARGGNYGSPAMDAPLLEHALVTGAYNDGAYYPIGGPAIFAETLLPVIKAVGGKAVLGADVETMDLVDGHVAGVSYKHGGKLIREGARHIVSTIGVLNTLKCLPADAATAWRDAASVLHPGAAYCALYLGFDGDIRAAGASSANIWLYEQPGDIDRMWDQPAAYDAPALFVSFPSLKDPAHQGKHTAEVLALCSADSFAKWFHNGKAAPNADYAAFKTQVEVRLIAQFERHWPDLSAMIRFHELSTPLSQNRFVRTPAGSMYGLEMSAGRLTSNALTIRTPVPGLLIAGQDVVGAGVQPSSISGMFAAAAIVPSLLRHMNG